MSGFARWINDSLRRRIAAVVSLLAFALGLGVVVVSYFEVLRVTRELQAARLHQLGEQLAPLLARAPVELLTRLTRVAADSAIVSFVSSGGNGDRQRVIAALRAAPADQRSMVALLEPTGRVLLHAGPDSQQAWLGPPIDSADLAPREQPGVGPHRRLNDSTLYYDAHAPIRHGSEIVAAAVRRTRMQLSATSRSTFGVILGSGTNIVFGSPATGVWTDLGAVIPAPSASELRTGAVTRFRWQGKEVLALAVPIAGTPWQLAVRTDYAVVGAPARAYLGRAALIAALVITLGTLGGVALGRALGQPLERITEVTEQIASADDPRRVDERGPGEVGRLGRAFNAMVERLAASTRRLRDNEASHRAFVSHTSEGIWRIEFVPPIGTGISRELQVASWFRMAPLAECNAALARMHGVELTGELGSIPLEQLFPPDDPETRTLFTAFIENGYRASEVESRLTRSGEPPRAFVNDLIGILEQGGLRRIWGTRRDVTLLRLMDDRLAQTQRLEAIGRLAGGIAHDFNNLLTAIFGYAEALQERLPAGDPGKEDAAEIDRLAGRASELTRHLLAFSRGQVLRAALLDLNAVVRSTEVLLRRVIGEDIELKLQLAEPVLSVTADEGQLERVLMNLAINARDAMLAGGSLELRTASVELDAEYARTRPGVEPGRYAMLAVSDSGSGMTEEVRRHVFEPFFTTKPKGRGTGLGLSTAYGIIRQSGGDITLYTEPGKGTTFKIYLPLRGSPAAPSSERATGSAAGGHTGHETILLVEDEAPVREVVRRALTAAGYAVLVAREAAEALQIAEAQGQEIALLLTDMILPGMTGRDLAAELRRLRPELRVIIMSGYTGETYPALESLPGGTGYLEKPFSIAALREKVRTVLDGAD